MFLAKNIQLREHRAQLFGLRRMRLHLQITDLSV